MGLYTQKLKKNKGIVTNPMIKKIIKKSTFPLLSIGIFLGTVCYLNNQNYGLALEYNGKNIANVSSEDVYEKANHMVRDQLTPDGKSKVESATSQLKVVPISKKECCESPSEIKNKIIENSQDMFVEACGVYVDGKLIGVGENEENLKEMFTKALEEQQNANSGKIVELAENVEFKGGFFSPEDVKTNDQLKKYFFNKTEKDFKYLVNEGDTVSSVAEKFNISEETIRECNNIENEELTAGDTLTIAIKESILNFRIFEIITEEKEIPFETETHTNDDQYTSWSKVIQEGSTGKETFRYKVEYKNGKEISRIEENHEIISTPITKIIEIGTKQAPEGFMWPVPYTKNITSPFGPRWGTIHKGIDIAASGVNGKDIVASEDGVVEKASYGSKGYGNHIIIKHSGKYSTLYAHCQSLCVQVGQKVKKGDVIAKVGSTGDSTGPHLHFEIRENGIQVNPKNYV